MFCILRLYAKRQFTSRKNVGPDEEMISCNTFTCDIFILIPSFLFLVSFVVSYANKRKPTGSTNSMNGLFFFHFFMNAFPHCLHSATSADESWSNISCLRFTKQSKNALIQTFSKEHENIPAVLLTFLSIPISSTSPNESQ